MLNKIAQVVVGAALLGYLVVSLIQGLYQGLVG